MERKEDGYFEQHYRGVSHRACRTFSIARACPFVFEPPGDIHTLITEDEEVVTLFILSGALQYFDDYDQITSQDDIYTVLKKYRNHCLANDIPFREDLIY